ncbi:GH25 family lysozyme [Streptomyces sp. NPDC059913]|uniref:GH25 family lysozyme n=1 Tax=unclassified Streptomyces TaxID=2593676 RepID=UPI003655DF9E
MTVKGVDVSSYQSATFSTSGLSFVFVKATEGATYVNPKMTAQAAHARAAGCVVGFYHFLRPGDMKAQAAYFVKHAASVEGDPLFADWEDSGVSCAQKDAFLAEVKRLRGSTHRVGLYCNYDYWTRRDTTSNAGDALWIADYVTAGRPRIKAAWTFHQYTDKPLDTNVATFKDKAALRAWATVGATKPSTPSTPSKPKPYTPPAFPAGLTPGKAKPSARTLQRALKVTGFMPSSVKEADNYGPQTQAAVARFHNAHPSYRAAGKSHDPAIGPKGWAYLFRTAYAK